MVPGTVPFFATGGGPSDFEFFTASGTFNVPASVSEVWVFLAGGGGGSGGVLTGGTDQGTASSGSGGVGGLSIGYLTVTPGSSISVTVGAGGSGGNAGGNGYSGGTSTFSSMTATGGGGGGSNFNAYTGSPGSGSGGSILSGWSFYYPSNITNSLWSTYINNMLANWVGVVDYSNIEVLRDDNTTGYSGVQAAQQWTTAQTTYRPGTRGNSRTGYTVAGRGGFEGVCLLAWNV